MSKKIAVFVDYDNQQLDVFALIELLRERGRVVIRRAYADWVARQSYRKTVTQAGFELIDCPKTSATHKNSADIRLATDCLSVSYENDDIETYVIVTGDVDFVPLINKLRAMGRETTVVASDSSAADLLQQACDEFIPAFRLDQIETVSKGQLTFEESLSLLKKAYEQIKLKGQNLESRDIRSVLKQAMLQLNPSFDEKDYEECNSFTNYLDKARMFIKLDGIFETRKEIKTAPTEEKDGQTIKFPGTLLIKVYNEVLRKMGDPVTIRKYEKTLFEMHQDFSLKLYGFEDINQLLNEFKKKGFLKIKGAKIEIEPQVRFELTLNQLKLFHDPQIRRTVIQKIISLSKDWDEERRDLTLNELKKSILEESDIDISRSDFDGIINALKIGGAFLSPDNVPISSLNIPLHLLSDDPEQLEDIVLCNSILKLVNLSNIENSDSELGALSDLLVGKQGYPRLARIKKLFKKLESSKKIAQKSNYWVKKYGRRPAGS